MFVTKEMLLLSISIGYSGGGEYNVLRCVMTVKLNRM